MNFDAYLEKDAIAWDEFVLNVSLNGTFLHTRRFLSYHADRFVDCSIIIRDNKGGIMAVFPAALLPSDETVVVSHPGITYGGIIAGAQCRGNKVVDIIRSICTYFTLKGCSRIIYKVIPYIYHRIPFQDDLYALFRIGAQRCRCDITATIDLSNRARISSRRKRAFKKALNAEVTIKYGVEYVSQLWDILSANLALKHNAKPVHSLSEITILHNQFPKEIQFVVAEYNGEVVAGTVLFKSPKVTHSQYIASCNVGYSVNALDMVFEYCISQSCDCEIRYFDFGISNEDAGLVLNEGLYKFKSEFGAGSCVHEFYEMDLVNSYVS